METKIKIDTAKAKKVVEETASKTVKFTFKERIPPVYSERSER